MQAATTSTEKHHRFSHTAHRSRHPVNCARMEDDFEMSSGGASSSRVDAARKNFRDSGNTLLGNPLFPQFEEGDQAPPSTIEQMQEQDPLAAQVWKFFTKTKQQLPNAQRMENLTWRMMALSMRKRSQDEQK